MGRYNRPSVQSLLVVSLFVVRHVLWAHGHIRNANNLFKPSWVYSKFNRVEFKTSSNRGIILTPDSWVLIRFSTLSNIITYIAFNAHVQMLLVQIVHRQIRVQVRF